MSKKQPARTGMGRALAELIAGTKRPRFLIIDEGFGPLDEMLRQKSQTRSSNYTKRGNIRR